jgi:sn-glycerol 3-phosphate transport system substrate-binding protein
MIRQVGLGWLAAGAFLFAAEGAAAQTEIQWWHAMTGGNNKVVVDIANDFNNSQKDYKVIPTYKGGYADTMNAGIAAFRAGQAPHIMQVFEVDTATMMSATGAVKPVHLLMKEAGEAFDPKVYLPTITGYYSTSKGEMLSMPFNSSSAVMWYNKDAFKKAGLDPNAPPKTWPDVFAAAKKLKAAGYNNCGFGNAWAPWLNIEQLSAWHNVPLATKSNGMDGFDTELKFNSPLHVKHLENLVELQKDKTYDYSGRTNTGEGRFTSGECPIFLTSSAFFGNVKANAKFDFANAPMPYYPDVVGAPQNSIIGGASLWVMGGKSAQEYKGVAKFFTFLSDTDRQIAIHKASGYLPITKAAYAKAKASGYYKEFPYLETPLLELTNKEPTENSRGLRLGNMVQLRDVWSEEIESALSGKKTAKQALDDAVSRGNQMLRQFERTVSR